MKYLVCKILNRMKNKFILDLINLNKFIEKLNKTYENCIKLIIYI